MEVISVHWFVFLSKYSSTLLRSCFSKACMMFSIWFGIRDINQDRRAVLPTPSLNSLSAKASKISFCSLERLSRIYCRWWPVRKGISSMNLMAGSLLAACPDSFEPPFLPPEASLGPPTSSSSLSSALASAPSSLSLASSYSSFSLPLEPMMSLPSP